MPQIVLHAAQIRKPSLRINPCWALLMIATASALACGIMLCLGTIPSAGPASSLIDPLAQTGWLKVLIGAALVLGGLIAIQMPSDPPLRWPDPAKYFTIGIPFLICVFVLWLPHLALLTNGNRAMQVDHRFYLLKDFRKERELTEAEFKQIQRQDTERINDIIRRDGLATAAMIFTCGALYTAWWIRFRSH